MKSLPKRCKYHIVAATHVTKHEIALTFADGTRKVIDFHLFLTESGNPMNTQFRPVRAFKKFFIDRGNLCWTDHEMEFEGEYLYKHSGQLI